MSVPELTCVDCGRQSSPALAYICTSCVTRRSAEEPGPRVQVPVVCPCCPDACTDPHMTNLYISVRSEWSVALCSVHHSCLAEFRDRALKAIEKARQKAQADHEAYKAEWGRQLERMQIDVNEEIGELRQQLAETERDRDTARSQRDGEIERARTIAQRIFDQVDGGIKTQESFDWWVRHAKGHIGALHPNPDAWCTFCQGGAPRPIDPRTREKLAEELRNSLAYVMGRQMPLQWKEADRIISLIGPVLITEDYERELHSGHTLLYSTYRPADVKKGWMWCVKRSEGCMYVTPERTWCKEHKKMDACWSMVAAGEAEADGGGKGTGA